MHLDSNSWPFLNRGEFNLAKVAGWHAIFFAYWQSPHRTLVLRLESPGDPQEKVYLYCVFCGRLEIESSWTIDNLEFHDAGNDRYLIEDKKRNIRIECSSAMLFSEERFRGWLGECAWMMDSKPSQDDLKKYCQKIASSL